ncbi:MAG: cytochrome-c peroxidase, partial [Bacteroidota bacterium]
DNVEALGYKDFFDQAFNEIPVGERYTDTIAGLAMAAYERTTLSNEAPFQQWLAGKGDAMTEAEKKGAILFFGEAGCVRCHTGPALNSTAFYALGMNDLDGEGVTYVPAQASFTSAEGRGGFTGKDEDYYKFKVPQLYNLKDSPFYGHGANFTSVKSVIEYKNAAQPQNTNVPASQIHDGFQPLNLSNEEIDQLTIFIENSLYDPNLDRYAPDQLPSGNCFPNSDAQSRIDLNCE